MKTHQLDGVLKCFKQNQLRPNGLFHITNKNSTLGILKQQSPERFLVGIFGVEFAHSYENSSIFYLFGTNMNWAPK